MKTCATWLLSLFMLICISPFNAQAATNEPGVVLAFDDDYVDTWHDYFITNNQNFDLSNVKVTFFISNFHLLSTDKINKLHALEAAGHEIASHSYSHGEINTDDPTINDPAKVTNYLNTQVLPSINNMVAAGFSPVSFSYPSGGHTAAYDDAIRAYLPYLRSGYANEGVPLSTIDRLYHNSDKHYSFLEGDSIDSSGQNELPEIEDALTRASNNTEILTLYTHRILPDGQTHTYGLNVSKLNGIINKARQLGLRFYTFSEAHSVGPAAPIPCATGNPNNISVSVELSSRVRVQWSNMPANNFLGIVPVGSQYPVTGADTNSSPSGNIGINVPGAQAGQAYTAVLHCSTDTNPVVTSASFVLNPGSSTNQTLTVSKTGTGAGIVTSSPSGINCGADCTETYTNGTSVTLTAVADTGSTFSSWSGGGCSGTGTCTVSMTAAQSVSANFTADTPPSGGTISISIENNNRVRLNWSNMPNHDFVGIVPTNQPDWTASMSGANTNGSASGKMGITVSEAVAGQEYSAVFYLNNVRVTASAPFVIIPGSPPANQTLTTSKTGTGTGNITSSPAGISCGADCTETYPTGSSVTLTAVADTGSTFSGWSGAGCSGTGTCTVNMTAAQTVSAGFTSNTPPPQTGTINITVENQNRVRSKWNGFAADFIGIVPVGQPEWQQGMEGASVNGNATSGNVGVTVNNAPYNQQYVVMFYLNSTKVATSDPFVIRTTP